MRGRPQPVAVDGFRRKHFDAMPACLAVRVLPSADGCIGHGRLRRRRGVSSGLSWQLRMSLTCGRPAAAVVDAISRMLQQADLLRDIADFGELQAISQGASARVPRGRAAVLFTCMRPSRGREQGEVFGHSAQADARAAVLFTCNRQCRGAEQGEVFGQSTQFVARAISQRGPVFSFIGIAEPISLSVLPPSSSWLKPWTWIRWQLGWAPSPTAGAPKMC